MQPSIDTTPSEEVMVRFIHRFYMTGDFDIKMTHC